MKKFAISGLVLLLVSCTPSAMDYAYKPNMTPVSKQQDFDGCAIASFKAIPQTMVTEVSGGYYRAGDIACRTNSKGRTDCQRVGEVNIPPYSTTYDANADLRTRFIKACMQKKGYSVLSLPMCKTTEESRQALNARKAAEVTCIPKGTPRAL